MMAVHDYRRVHLLKIIDDLGGVNKAGGILGYTNGSFLTQMSGPNPERKISEKTARKFEEKLGLESGSMDTPVDVKAPLDLFKRTVNKPLNAAELTALILLVGEMCEQQNVTLSSAKFAALVVLTLENPKPDYVLRLVKLMV